MCFSVASFAYRLDYAAPIFRSFEPSPWHVATWHGNGCLRNNCPIARQAFLRLGIVLVLQLTVLNFPGPIFTLLVTQVKIVIIEPAKPICTLFPIKHCRHRPPQAFDAIRQPISSNWNRKAKLIIYNNNLHFFFTFIQVLLVCFM